MSYRAARSHFFGWSRRRPRDVVYWPQSSSEDTGVSAFVALGQFNVKINSLGAEASFSKVMVYALVSVVVWC